MGGASGESASRTEARRVVRREQPERKPRQLAVLQTKAQPGLHSVAGKL